MASAFPFLHDLNYVSSQVIKYNHVKIQGNDNVLLGSFITVSGNFNKAKRQAKIYGDFNQAHGDLSEVRGNNNKVAGDNSCVYGNRNIISGNQCEINGNYNVVRGHKCKITGNNNIILGTDCTAKGDNNTFVPPGAFHTEFVTRTYFEPEPPLSSADGPFPMTYDSISYFPVSYEHPASEGLDDIDELVSSLTTKPKMFGIDGRCDIASDSATPCSICCANDTCIVLIQCGHMTMCITCAKEHRDTNKTPTCPVCRAGIKAYQYVFK